MKGKTTTYILKDGINPKTITLILMILLPCGIGLGYWIGDYITSDSSFNDGFTEGLAEGNSTGYALGNSTGFELGNLTGFELGNLTGYIQGINESGDTEVIIPTPLKSANLTVSQFEDIYFRFFNDTQQLFTDQMVMNGTIRLEISRNPMGTDSVRMANMRTLMSSLATWYNDPNAQLEDYPAEDWWSEGNPSENVMILFGCGGDQSYQTEDNIEIIIPLNPDGSLNESVTKTLYETQLGSYIINEIQFSATKVNVGNFDAVWTADLNDDEYEVTRIGEVDTINNGYLFTSHYRLYPFGFDMTATVFPYMMAMIMNISLGIDEESPTPTYNTTIANSLTENAEILMNWIEVMEDANPFALKLFDGADITIGFGNSTFNSTLFAYENRDIVDSHLRMSVNDEIYELHNYLDYLLE